MVIPLQVKGPQPCSSASSQAFAGLSSRPVWGEGVGSPGNPSPPPLGLKPGLVFLDSDGPRSQVLALGDAPPSTIFKQHMNRELLRS